MTGWMRGLVYQQPLIVVDAVHYNRRHDCPAKKTRCTKNILINAAYHLHHSMVALISLFGHMWEKSNLFHPLFSL